MFVGLLFLFFSIISVEAFQVAKSSNVSISLTSVQKLLQAQDASQQDAESILLRQHFWQDLNCSVNGRRVLCLFDIDDTIFPFLDGRRFDLVEEPFTAHLIKRLQDLGCDVGCLTHRRAVINPELVQQAFARLQRDFGVTLSFYPRLNLPGVKFYQGIMYYAGSTKGNNMLRVFDSLRQADSCFEVPQKIIFFDDIKNHCNSVLKACRKRGIDSVSFHYTYARKDPKNNKTLWERMKNTFHSMRDYFVKLENYVRVV